MTQQGKKGEKEDEDEALGGVTGKLGNLKVEEEVD